jgi:hypothetical protein
MNIKKKPVFILRNTKILLHDIVDTSEHKCVLDEVRILINYSFPGIDFECVERAYSDVIKLFTGEYPGYRECTTAYHDLRHTMDVFLTMARIIHGAHVDGHVFDNEDVKIGLLSALLHDTGYILTDDDDSSSGGKYTLTHVKRSVDFMLKYFARNFYPLDEAKKASHLIESTSLTADFDSIPYASLDIQKLGKMIFASDMLGQMADRTYLEKLHLLYDEFVEGNVTEFKDEADLMRNTISFVEAIRSRIALELRSVDRYLKSHFKARCNINRDFYSESVQSNLDYLKTILSESGNNYHSKLKRMGILERVGKLSN